MIADKKPMVDDFLKDLLVETKFIKGLPNPACTTFANNGVCGDIYRIFIDKKFEQVGQEILDGLYMHEAGHIIFGHMKNAQTKNSIQKMKVRAAYSKVAKRFDSREQFEKYFDKMLFNIVEDFEVNSKLFEPDDYRYMDAVVTKNKGFYPSDYDFPLGKDYNVYLNLILADPEAFFQKMKEKMQNQQGGDGESQEDDTPNPFQNDQDMQNGNGKGSGKGSGKQQNNSNGGGSGGGNDESDDKSQDGSQSRNGGNSEPQKNEEKSQNGSGNGDKKDNNSSDSGEGQSNPNQGKTSTQKNKSSGNGGKNKKPLADNWKFSKEEIETLKKEAEAHDENLIKQVIQSLEGVSHTKGRGNDNSYERINEILEIKSFESLEKYITKELMKNTKTIKRDMLYNYNRNKIGTSVLIPAVRHETLTKKATIYAIVDTSGSVDSRLVQGFTGSFRKISKKLGYGSRIIYCHTFVEADYGPKDDIRSYRGGGTRIANGIQYVRDKYNPKSQDVVYVISDFEDSMDEWNVILDTMHCKKKGILWGGDLRASQGSHLNEVLSFEI